MSEEFTPKSESAERLVADFDYDLPPELIAQQPPSERGASRMLLLDRQTGVFRDSLFSQFAQHLRPGDLVVLNDSSVIPARLFARRTLVREREKPSGRIEVMLTEPVLDSPGSNQWHALVRPSRKVAIGERLVFPASDGSIALEADVLERGKFGERLLEFAPLPNVADFFSVLDRIGHIPLPTYIHRDDAVTDRDRYQTVFAHERGSVAAPTAGLHFTPEVFAQLSSKGIEITHVTLHVGLGTFAPLRVDRVDDVHLHRERYSISAEAADLINSAARSASARIVAVGTTVVRTLESAALAAGSAPLQPHSGETSIFISPGFQFRLVSALLTNFHLPQSSLLMLVSAFAGPEDTGLNRVLASYRHAIEEKYRFFSYGDCMFIS
ncbi:MAG: tRNA preQ1(34) S-adenosylmethionine ribosyltransferase-isomerase QueA [Terracidiphilus sp.]